MSKIYCLVIFFILIFQISFSSYSHNYSILPAVNVEPATSQYNDFALTADFEIFYKNGKQGLADKNGEIIVPAEYREIRINRNNTISALPFTEWKIFDGENNLIQKMEFDYVIPVGEGIYKVGINEHTMLINTKGDLLAEMKTQEIGEYFDGKAVFTDGGKYGVINDKGIQLIPAKYDSLFLSGGYVIAKSNADRSNPWSILDFSGSTISQSSYQDIKGKNEGLFAVKRNDSWGYINTDGIEVIPNQYDEAPLFSGRFAIAKYMGSDGVINKKGEWVIMPRADHLKAVENDVFLFRTRKESGLLNPGNKVLFKTVKQFLPLNYGFIEKNSRGELGLIDHKGRRLLVTEYDEISPLQQDTVYYFRKENRWGILSKRGKVMLGLDNPVQQIFPMGEEFIGVKINNKFGFIDINGNLRIANQYEGIGKFSEGLGAVKILGKWGYVDRIERLIIQPLYEEAYEFRNGLAKVKKAGKYGLVDIDGDVVLNTLYDSLKLNKYDRYLIRRKGKVGLADKDGRQLIYPKYDNIRDLGNGYVMVERKNKFGLLTLQGVSTIPLMYNHLEYDPYNNVYIAAQKPDWETISLQE